MRRDLRNTLTLLGRLLARDDLETDEDRSYRRAARLLVASEGTSDHRFCERRAAQILEAAAVGRTR